MSASKEEMLERVSELSIHNHHTVSHENEETVDGKITQLDQSSGPFNSLNVNKKKKKKKKTGNQEKVLPSQKLVETTFPWKVVQRPGRGRCAVASRNIKAGEVIVAERAVAFMPRVHYHLAVCHSCCCDFAENSDGVKCNSCQKVIYCKTCEEKALSQHRRWCSVYKEINRIAKESDCDQDLVHFVLSLFSKKYSDPDNRKVVGIESTNVGGQTGDGIINSSFQLCVSYINLYEPRSTRKHELLVTKHFDCNCQRCLEPLESSPDRFLEGCMCNFKGCDGVLMKRTSLNGHVSGDGKLTPWICDTCSRVLDPMSFDAEGKQIAETPWILVGRAEEQMAIAMSAYRERRLKDARALLESFNVNFSGKLHHLHVLLFDSLTPLMNCHRAVGDAEGGVRVCRKILTCLEKVLPSSSLELANFYFCFGEMCSEHAESSDISPFLAKHYKKQAHEAFQRVRQIRKICLGKPDLPN